MNGRSRQQRERIPFGHRSPDGVPERSVVIGWLLVLLLWPAVLQAQQPPGPVAMVRLAPLSSADIERVARLGIEIPGDPFARERILFVDPRELAALRAEGFDPRIIEPDATAFFLSRLDASLGPGSMGGYYTLAEAETVMDDLASRYPEVVSPRFEIGRSHYNRPIWAFRISDDPLVPHHDRPAVMYNALIHAREPISLMIVLAFAEELARKAAEGEPSATWLLANRDLWFVPVINPDGYYYNQSIAPAGGGMWRKNLRDNNESGTFEPSSDGVDLNRNFGYMWGFNNTGSSPNPASAVYRGPEAFSEPETRALRDLVQGTGWTARPDWAYILNYHSYSNVYIHPWGYSSQQVEHQAEFNAWGRAMSRFNHYPWGTGTGMIGYHTNGDAVDWQYGAEGILAKVPEVGSLFDYFWPATVRIPVLVRENMGPNWITAWMAGGVLLVREQQVSVVGGGAGGEPEGGDLFDLSLGWHHAGRSEPLSGAVATLTALTGDADVLTPVVMLGDFTPGEQRTPDPFRIQFGPVPPGRKVMFQVRVEAEGGYVRLDTLGVVAGPATVLLEEDWESGTGRWQLWGGFQRTTGAAFSGTYGLTDAPAGNPMYEVSAVDLRQPLDLQHFSGAQLSFQSRRQVGARNMVFVTVGDRPDPWPSASPPEVPSPLIYYSTGVDPEWEQVRIDLTPFAGTPVLYLRLATGYITSAPGGWAIDDLRIEGWTAVEPGEPGTGPRLRLGRPFPNPSRPAPAVSVISMDLDLSGFSGLVPVTFEVRDVRGRLVATPLIASLESMYYRALLQWNGLDGQGHPAASGIYLLVVRAGGEMAVRKAMIVR